MMMMKPMIMDSDIPMVRSILEMDSFDYHKLISNMDIKQLQDFAKVIEETTGTNTDQNLKIYLRHFEIFKQLQDQRI
jgi:hypothetical protein